MNLLDVLSNRKSPVSAIVIADAFIADYVYEIFSDFRSDMSPACHRGDMSTPKIRKRFAEESL